MLPAVVVILALILGACAVGAQHIALEEAARIGARAAARGENPETITRMVQGIDEDFTVETVSHENITIVRVSATAPGIIGQFGDLQQRAEASASLEYSTSKP
ncbi:pilus assembly protein TadE [Rothia sp. ZJ932]|nr:pilus assembly protein TadE [Rothia sp. ZJ1223]QRZ62523.1 pilus assembly protein TadE [Rothia sp. ZJ932]